MFRCHLGLIIYILEGISALVHLLNKRRFLLVILLICSNILMKQFLDMLIEASDVVGYPKTLSPGGKPDLFGRWTREIIPELDSNKIFVSFFTQNPRENPTYLVPEPNICYAYPTTSLIAEELPFTFYKRSSFNKEMIMPIIL